MLSSQLQQRVPFWAMHWRPGQEKPFIYVRTVYSGGQRWSQRLKQECPFHFKSRQNVNIWVQGFYLFFSGNGTHLWPLLTPNLPPGSFHENINFSQTFSYKSFCHIFTLHSCPISISAVCHFKWSIKDWLSNLNMLFKGK